MVRRRTVSVRDAAWQVMEEAYLKATANGTLPAHARQIMYAARPHIQATADRDLGARFDQYFTQQLLPDYIEENGVDWNVVYDARGHFREPHTEHEVPLGTLQVRELPRRRSQATRRPELDFELSESALPDPRPAPSLRRRAVHREGRLHAAVRGGEARRALRHRHHVDQGHERHRQPAAGRGAVRRARHPAARAARLRQVRLLDRRHAASATPAAIPSRGTSRSTTSGCASRISTGSRPRSDAQRQRRRGGREPRGRTARRRRRSSSCCRNAVELNAFASDELVDLHRTQARRRSRSGR